MAVAYYGSCLLWQLPTALTGGATPALWQLPTMTMAYWTVAYYGSCLLRGGGTPAPNMAIAYYSQLWQLPTIAYWTVAYYGSCLR